MVEFDVNAHPEFARIWQKAAPYTMTSPERGFALYNAVRTLIGNGVDGAFVECGVWRGGSSMIIALTLLEMDVERDILMFDTFAGMTEAGPEDLDINGEHADDLMDGSQGAEMAELVRAAATRDDVYKAMESTGYWMRSVRMIEGDVRQTLAGVVPPEICLLRLDTDFYDSTMSELRYLYPRLVPGGVIIIDDYGHWHGARKAFDDYFRTAAYDYRRPMMWRIDYTGYGGMKTEGLRAPERPRYDYIPPGMTPPDLLPVFPDAEIQEPWGVRWPYLRSQIPHFWRQDTRNKTGFTTGNASVEEAACLFAVARQFAGKRGLEIGTHFGWTGAHLLAAGLELDCIDPAFEDPERHAQVSADFDKIEGRGGYRLWPGLSPAVLDEVRAAGDGSPWSFAFIDGDHDGDAPTLDAAGVIPHLAEDAVVMFHDLVSPDVEAGLATMRDAGFSTRLFNTMQVMGVAWRGAVEIPEHVADPNATGLYQPHLQKHLKDTVDTPNGATPTPEAETGSGDAPSGDPGGEVPG